MTIRRRLLSLIVKPACASSAARPVCRHPAARTSSNLYPAFRSFSTTSLNLRERQRNGLVPLDGLSHVSGPTTPALLEETLGDFFSRLVSNYRDSPALISRHEAAQVHRLNYAGQGVSDRGEECIRWSYGEFERHVDALARGLLKYASVSPYPPSRLSEF